MNPRSNKLLMILAVVLLADLGYGMLRYDRAMDESGDDLGAVAVRKYARVLRLVHDHYLEPEDVAYPDMVDASIRGALDSLDPYSTYIPPVQYKQVTESTQGSFGGIGVRLKFEDDNAKITITFVFRDQPAARAGIEVGDQVTKVDGVDVSTMDPMTFVSNVKGKAGTSVEITVYRESADQILMFRVKRAKIPIITVRLATMLESGIGYLFITEFNQMTAKAVETAIARLVVQGASTLVIDMRDNPGGVMEGAVRICSLFLDEGDLVVYTKGRFAEDYNERRARGGRKFLDLKLVILINKNSASASEIVAGCLRDHRKAVLVGERSFGKAFVQQIFSMRDGSAVKLTIARYFTPQNQPIHDKGVVPDTRILIEDETTSSLFRWRMLQDPVAKSFKALEWPEDRQLDAALRIARGQDVRSDKPAEKKADAGEPGDVILLPSGDEVLLLPGDVLPLP